MLSTGSQRCVGAGEIDEGVHHACSNDATGLRVVVFDRWSVTVALCPSHQALWDDEVRAPALLITTAAERG